MTTSSDRDVWLVKQFPTLPKNKKKRLDIMKESVKKILEKYPIELFSHLEVGIDGVKEDSLHETLKTKTSTDVGIQDILFVIKDRDMTRAKLDVIVKIHKNKDK